MVRDVPWCVGHHSEDFILYRELGPVQGKWDPYRECQINTLDRVQNKAAKFAHQTEGSEWEFLGQRRKIERLCALYKAYSGERS